MNSSQRQITSGALTSSKVKTELISKDIGRGLLATHNISKGDLILTVNEPFIALPTNDHLSTVCYHCFKREQRAPSPSSGGTLERCKGCMVVRYCSKDCQVQSWSAIHKLECKILKKIAPNILPTTTHALLQILLLAQRAPSNARLDTIMELSSHGIQLQRKTQAWKDIALQVEAAMHYSGFDRARAAVAQEIFCRMENNSFQILQLDDPDTMGYCFDDALALANHSCRPNAMVRFSGRVATLTALRNIERDEQILISYIDTKLDAETRRTQLRERYFFDCECSRCCRREDIAKETERLFRERAPAVEGGIKTFLSRHPKDELPAPGPGLTILGELKRMCTVEAEAGILDLEFGDDLWQDCQDAKEELRWLQAKLAS